MQSKPTESPSYYVKDAWLMSPDGEYVQLYKLPADAKRAARDINRTGIARHPAEYDRMRRVAA